MTNQSSAGLFLNPGFSPQFLPWCSCWTRGLFSDWLHKAKHGFPSSGSSRGPTSSSFHPGRESKTKLSQARASQPDENLVG